VLYLALVGGAGLLSLMLGLQVPAAVGGALAATAFGSGIAIGAATGGLFCGSLLGGVQMIVLRRRGIARRWLAATAGSMSLAAVLAATPLLVELGGVFLRSSTGMPAPPPAWSFGPWRLLPAGGLLGGLLVGAAQAWAIRATIRLAAAWMLLTGIGVALGSALEGPGPVGALVYMTTGAAPRWGLWLLLGAPSGWALQGIVTGLLLPQLLRAIPILHGNDAR
jgi:hypothetical protein